MEETPEKEVQPEISGAEEKVDVATLEDLEDTELPFGEVTVTTRRGKRRLVLQGLPRPEFDDLVTRHAPRPGLDVDVKNVPLRWNPTTFQPALVAACSLEPVLSEAEVNKLWAKWNKASTQAVFVAALDLNETEGVVDLGKFLRGSGLMKSLLQNSGGA